MNSLKYVFCLLSICFINQIFAQVDPYYSIPVDAGELETTLLDK